MLFRLSSLVAVQALMAATAVAAPAIEVPAALAPRAGACPTTSRWEAWHYETTWLSTTTVTNGWSSLGSVTSTKTEEETRTINTRTTVFSPLVTTLPATTITPTVATNTTTVTWYTRTETVTSSGYAPPSVCKVRTFTHTIPGTTSTTLTMDLSYVNLLLSLPAFLSAPYREVSAPKRVLTSPTFFLGCSTTAMPRHGRARSAT
ncbi:hypothetical protein C7999DRAFT_16849 [Corynascus novoguineensis]|uniref:Uncharacterized protein n=1 Tax=Corynascus novoguineensis TaxID=1126955 RepID=A0AAN7CNC5_9PEZI|nr:hypothetical protein C7999DRAFT_16849 [Corynascus novoguineensis]